MSQQQARFRHLPNFCPHLKQIEFIAGRDVYPIRAVIAGTGSGKTIMGTIEALKLAQLHPGSVGYIFSPTYRMFQRNILPTLDSDLILGSPFYLNDLIAGYNRVEQKLTFQNGSEWYFVSLTDPENAEGANIDYAWLDEARLVRHFAVSWKMILRRLRGSGRCARFPFSVWITTTPDMPGSDLYDIVENPATKSPSSRLYRWTVYDNPTLSQDYLKEMERTHTGGLADRFIWGRFATVAGGSFAFDSSIHVAEADRTLLRTFRYGVDFGWTNPSALIATGYDGDGREYVLDELYKSMMTSDEMIQQLKEWRALYGVGPILCDPSSPEHIAKFVAAGLPASGYTFKRADGIRELGSRFLKAGDGRPRIYVSKVCVNLISELLEYREDVKERDHTVDGTRYATPISVFGEVTVRRGIVR